MSELEQQPTVDPDAAPFGDAPDEDADTDEAEDERDGEPEEARDIGERITALVEKEAAAAEADEQPTPEAPKAPPPDPYTRTCPTCQGFGHTQTGSLVDGQEFRECISCTGKGWQERLEASADEAGPAKADPSSQDGWKWR